jgi:hypothetical protein
MSRVSYTGDGINVAFAVPFSFFDPADVSVIERTIASGVETAKLLNVDYTVAGGGGSTGTVTASLAPASTKQWIILRATPLTQLIDYVSNDGFPADTHEAGLDRAAMRAQEIQEKLGRSLKFPPGDSAALDPTLPSSIERAGKVLGFDVNGKPIPVIEIPSGALNLPMAIVDGGTGATTAGGARTALGAAGVADANIFSASQTIRSSDAGAGGGPDLQLDRASASPAVNDVLGAVKYLGRNAVGTPLSYATAQAEIVDPSNGSEDGLWAILTRVGGSLATRFKVGLGFYDPGATDGDKGAGTINVSGGYYVNGTPITAVPAGAIVQRTHTALSSVVAVSADIPVDDTAPQNTEGTQVLSHSHTPLAQNNKLLVRANLSISTAGGTPSAVVALFRSGQASAIAATLVDGPSFASVALEAEIAAPGTGAITFTVRVGNGGGTVLVNGDTAGNRLFSTIAKSTITVEELKV